MCGCPDRGDELGVGGLPEDVPAGLRLQSSRKRTCGWRSSTSRWPSARQRAGQVRQVDGEADLAPPSVDELEVTAGEAIQARFGDDVD